MNKVSEFFNTVMELKPIRDNEVINEAVSKREGSFAYLKLIQTGLH